MGLVSRLYGFAWLLISYYLHTLRLPLLVSRRHLSRPVSCRIWVDYRDPVGPLLRLSNNLTMTSNTQSRKCLKLKSFRFPRASNDIISSHSDLNSNFVVCGLRLALFTSLSWDICF
ncbi:hypothetical protein F5B20DRAFT_25186 [Whalleya microplaca]|nr:hypothetical protein F5B20DRAFT_25186 [Whalleya microplaca]